MALRTIFKWPILKFSEAASRDDPEREMYSDVFTLTGNNLKFYLRFKPTNTKEFGSKEHCSFYLMPYDLAEMTSVTLDFKLWIQNTDAGKIIEPRWGFTTNTFVEIDSGYGLTEFAHHDLLYSQNSTFIKRDTVFLCCEIRYRLPEPKKDKVQFMAEIQQKEFSFRKQGYGDLCTIRVDGQEFRVAKQKLMANSPVFEAMFKSGMQEAQNNVIQMQDTSPAAIDALIDYLDVHDLENLQEEALGLYLLAGRYMIEDLKEEATKILIEKLDEDNIQNHLVLAFRHNDATFKFGALDYLMAHTGCFKNIMTSDQWMTFASNNMEMAREIVNEVFGAFKWE